MHAFWKRGIFVEKFKIRKMKKFIYSIGMVILAITGAQAQQLNTAKSEVTFEIDNMKWKTVEGSFSGMKGDVVFDVNNLKASNFNVCIDAASVDTDNEKRDEHLKTEDFFDVSKYPTICFKSTSIVKTKEGYKAIGKLTMHGVTLEEEIAFTYTYNVFTGTLAVERYAYKIGEDTGEFMVGNEVKLQIKATL